MAEVTRRPARWRATRRSALGAVAALALAAAAGCSVPSSGSPVVVGPAPAGTSTDDRNPATTIPNPDEAQHDPHAMVEKYLEAALIAAATSDDPAKPAEAQGEFLAGKAQKQFVASSPSTAITIYAPWHGTDLVDIPPQGDPGDPEATWMKWDVVPIGSLDPATGILTPINEPKRTLIFEVGSVTSAEKDPGPQGTMDRIKFISPSGVGLVALDSYLRTSFPPHYIYWWNKAGDALVPDVRYLPAHTRVRYVTQIVNLVLGGEPASWIGPAVKPQIVPGATLQDPLVGVDTNPVSYSINLSAGAGGSKYLPQLAAQLRMSIGDGGRQVFGDPPPLELLVPGQAPVTDAGDDFRTLAHNFSQPRTSAQAYMIDSGRVRPTDFDIDGLAVLTNDKDLPPTLQNAANANAIYAGVGRDPSNVAIVREVNGKQSLTVIRDRTAKTIPIPGASLYTRPVWLAWPDKTLLVGVNGVLRVVDAGNRVHVVSGAAGPVTAFSVAPDGQRVAYVANGHLYLAVLTAAGSTPSLTPALEVNTTVWLDSVSAVSWGTSSYGLLVAGGSTVVVTDLYGTTAVQDTVAKVGSTITALASFAPDPFQPTVVLQAGPMMEASGRVYTTSRPRPGEARTIEPLKTPQEDGVLAPFFSD